MTTQPARSNFDTAGPKDLCRVAKVDTGLGVVIGFGAVCTEQGAPYYDLHGDHLPEDEALQATVEFMKTARSAKIMHEGEDVGVVLSATMISAEIGKALWGIDLPRTGVVITWAPTDKAMLAKFASGEWTGFSFGGSAYRDEVTE
jgi:hypothetical protein